MPIGHSAVPMMVTTSSVFARRSMRCRSESCWTIVAVSARNWYTVFEVKFGLTSTFKSVWKGGQNVYRLMVAHVNHAIARSACRSCRINFADLLLLSVRFQVDFMSGDLSAFSYRYFRTGSQQTAASLQGSSLAVMLRSFDEAVNTQLRDTSENYPEYQFRSDLCMAYRDEDIEKYRLKRDDILNEVTDAAGESSKIPRLQKALQEYDENFDVVGLVNLNWGHARVKSLNLDDRLRRERFISQSKSSIIKNKHALQYLAGQERKCRFSGMDQPISPQLLNLKEKDYGHAPCAQDRPATVANTCGYEVIDRLHHQVQGWWDLLPSRLVLQAQPWLSARQACPQTACSGQTSHNQWWADPSCAWAWAFCVQALSTKNIGSHQCRPGHWFIQFTVFFLTLSIAISRGESHWGAVFWWQAVMQVTQTWWTATTLTSERPMVSTGAEQVIGRGLLISSQPPSCISRSRPHF